MKDRLITHLRHVDLAVPDFDKQREFYTELWSLTPVADDSGIRFLAVEGSPEQYIVRLRRESEKPLSFDLPDSLTTPHMGTLMHFMHCNPQHHSLAIAQGPHTALHAHGG
jgi:catechol-2,3-dioxygenase